MILHKKPMSFYDVYTRKGAGKEVTHYCPGCGHGIAHKLIAELIDELQIQDRTIFCSPVGCAVFGYYYFDTANIQCSHGRAPAVATGLRRTLKDAVIISYQGDGDLAGIGTTEIIHAANRGENISVFFINNAIYGMTGGQMAPTTLLGQVTKTTPMGRSHSRDGSPIGMAEIIKAIKAPVFIERVSLATPSEIMKARRAFKKALTYQIEKKGFSFVEILSPCPVNWKMSPIEARKWMTEHLVPVFPVRNFRDAPQEARPAEEPMEAIGDTALLDLLRVKKELPKVDAKVLKEDQLVKISGFGGQGVLSAGILLANCAISEGLNATWLPSYGPEMRGGTANASVILSGKEIGSPVVDNPNVLIAMNTPSLLAFEKTVKPGGLLLVNSSVVAQKATRTDLQTLNVPASEIAGKEGLLEGANVFLLALYLLITGVVDMQTLKAVIPLSIKKKEALDLNVRIVEAASAYYKENRTKWEIH